MTPPIQYDERDANVPLDPATGRPFVGLTYDELHAAIAATSDVVTCDLIEAELARVGWAPASLPREALRERRAALTLATPTE